MIAVIVLLEPDLEEGRRNTESQKVYWDCDYLGFSWSSVCKKSYSFLPLVNGTVTPASGSAERHWRIFHGEPALSRLLSTTVQPSRHVPAWQTQARGRHESWDRHPGFVQNLLTRWRQNNKVMVLARRFFMFFFENRLWNHINTKIGLRISRWFRLL